MILIQNCSRGENAIVLIKICWAVLGLSLALSNTLRQALRVSSVIGSYLEYNRSLIKRATSSPAVS
jgi:hypothetical protein